MTQDHPIALVGARVVPVDLDLAPLDDAVVLLSDGRVEAVGSRSDVQVPGDAEVVDASGGWVLPGLVDAHVHLGVWEEGEGWAGQDTNEMTDPVMAAARAIDAINPRDAADDELALADRFGLSLGFHALDQAGYLAIVDGYAAAHGLSVTHADAIEWAARRGSRSGRVAWQFIIEAAGRAGRAL